MYGLEDSGETHALVLELVEGPTLQDRIGQGAIPLDEALPIARQIAEALEAAHEQGIIHRDLKPANIKVTPAGAVKVLDFGLAKALEPEQSEADVANSPTMSMTAPATKMGVIMGTAAYMSPEQAAVKAVDRRSDIWAFGVVVWEMLTGQQLFTGESVSHVLAAVLRHDPDWAALPRDVPPAVRRLLRRCLERNQRERLQHVGDARVEIRDALTQDVEVSPPDVTQTRRPSRGFIIGVTVLALLLAVGVLALRQAAGTQELAPVTRVAISLRSDAPLAVDLYQLTVALSPDGTKLVYMADVDGSVELYLRRLDQYESTPIPGTTGGTGPFFAPDGDRIGFFVGDQLMQVSLVDGRATPISSIGGGGLAPYDDGDDESCSRCKLGR